MKARMRNKHLGFVFQKYHLIPQYTVLQNVILPLLIRGGFREPAPSGWRWSASGGCGLKTASAIIPASFLAANSNGWP